jgi:hypothetical protein
MSQLPEHFSPELEELFKPHIESFNFFLQEGLKLAISDLDKVEIETTTGRLSWKIEDVVLGYPSRGGELGKDSVWPAEVLCLSFQVSLNKISRYIFFLKRSIELINSVAKENPLTKYRFMLFPCVKYFA